MCEGNVFTEGVEWIWFLHDERFKKRSLLKGEVLSVYDETNSNQFLVFYKFTDKCHCT